jgi:hypothetical protein
MKGWEMDEFLSAEDKEWICRLRDAIVKACNAETEGCSEPLRRTYQGAVLAAAERYAQGAVSAGLVSREQRAEAIYEIYNRMMTTNRKWRENLQTQDKGKKAR